MDRFPDRIETDRILCFPFCSQLCSCKRKGKTDGLCWLISNCLAGSTLHPLCLTLQAGCPGRMTAEDHGPCPLRLSNGSATRGHQAESEGQKEQGSGISSPLPPHQSTSSHYVPLPVVNLSFHDHIPAGF